MAWAEDIDRYFLRKAFESAAEFSKDPKTQTGVVVVRKDIILVSEANHFPQGLAETDKRLTEEKDDFMNHAELNAVFKSARIGIALGGATMYATWNPCVPCARGIISAGITRFVTSAKLRDLSYSKWRASCEKAISLLEEANVELRFVESPLNAPSILFDWKPLHV